MQTKVILICSLTAALLSSAHAQYVTVGDPGNPNDPVTGSLYGGVATTYAIGTYEVTINQ